MDEHEETYIKDMVVCVCIVLELLHIWTRCFKHWSHLPLFRGKCGGL